MAKIFLNGRIVPLEQAKISVLDRGFLYGDGVFESLRTYGRRPFLLNEHLKRLLFDAQQLKIKVPYSLSQLKTAVLKTVSANNFKEHYIKIIISRGAAKGHGLDPSNAAGKPTVIVLCEELKPYPRSLYEKGWRVIISKTPRASVPTSKIKSLCYVDNMLAMMEAKQAGADEAFMPDEKGHIVEGTVSNIFIVKRGKIITPPVAEPILQGITRALVIKLAGRAGFVVKEQIIAPKDLNTCDECFATMSGAGIVPVTYVVKKKIGVGKCGPITNALIDLCKRETSALTR
jgi:branched-chain amino acid aminotransferase